MKAIKNKQKNKQLENQKKAEEIQVSTNLQ